VKVDPAELHALAGSLDALGPYLEDLVLVGGWAHRIFHLHPWARPLAFAPLATNDVDFAVPARTAPREPTLASLLAAAGYEARHKSIHTRPPLVRYQRADGVMIEFVADLKGSAHDRKGNSKEVLEVAGITAEQLRFVYPLLARPWSPSPLPGFPVLGRVRVANPVTYLFQKLLVNASRLPPKDANDLIYIVDTVDVFGDHLDALQAEWRAVVAAGTVPAGHAKRFHAAVAALSRPGDVHRRAAIVAGAIGRPRSAEELAAVVALLAAHVFT
jgi:hypothetical protein